MKGMAGARKRGRSAKAIKPPRRGPDKRPPTLSTATKRPPLPPNPTWKPQAYKIVNNGHTIQANAAPGSTLTIGKDTYNLVQFHFHAPSEHSIGGKRAAMEVHFVHAGPDGRLAVVGVLMNAGRKNAPF